jgi:hypothetical protein
MGRTSRVVPVQQRRPPIPGSLSISEARPDILWLEPHDLGTYRWAVV